MYFLLIQYVHVVYYYNDGIYNIYVVYDICTIYVCNTSMRSSLLIEVVHKYVAASTIYLCRSSIMLHTTIIVVLAAICTY